MARPYNVQVNIDADFRQIESKAAKFGTRFGEIIEQSVKIGANPKITKDLEKYLRDQKRKNKQLVDEIADYRYATAVRNAGREVQKIAQLEQRKQQILADLSSTTINEETRKRLQAEKDIKDRRLKALRMSKDQQEANIKKLKDETEEIQRTIIKTGKSVEGTITRIEQGQKRSEEYAERFSKIMNSSSEEFVDTLESGLERLTSSLRGSIDVESMIKGGTGALSKGLGGVGDILGGIGAAGGEFAGIATALGAVATGLGAVVGIFGVFAAVMIGVDKEVKEFNKSVVSTFGSRSALNYGLDNFRHAVQDLQSNLGLTEQEAVGLFDALDQGGYSLQRITKGIEDVEERNRALNQSLQMVVATSKALGVSVNEFTNQATEMANTYATSLEDIVSQFSSIGKMAADAGFSTRRFYSLVTQASAGQAGLNVRLTDTAAVLTRLSKILGDKQAAGFMADIGSSFEKASSQDLMKTVAIAGAGDVRAIAKRELANQSRTFLGAAEAGGKTESLRTAATRAGVSVNLENADQLTEDLAAMTTEDRNRFIAAVTGMDSDLGRRLERLTAVSENAEGGITELPEAMRSFSTGGIIQTYAEMAETFGVELSNMNAIDRAAFANASGLSEDAISSMSRMAKLAEGNLSLLEGMKNMSAEELAAQGLTRETMLEQYGATIENGRVVDANGVELRDAMAYLTAASEAGVINDEAAKTEDLALAYKAFDETVTIGDILGNEVTNWLRAIYEDYGVPALNMLGDLLGLVGIDDGRDERRTLAHQLSEVSENLVSASQRQIEAKRALDTITRETEGRPLTISELTRKTEAEERLHAAEEDVADFRRARDAYSGTGPMSARITRGAEAERAHESRVGARRSAAAEEERRVSAPTREEMDRALATVHPEMGADARANAVAEIERLRAESDAESSAMGMRSSGPMLRLPGMGGDSDIDAALRRPDLAAASRAGTAPATRPTPPGTTPSARTPVVAPTPPRTAVPTPTTTPTPSAAPTPAAVPTPALAPTTGRTAEEATGELVEATTAAGDTAAEATRTTSEKTREKMTREGEETRKHLTKVLTKEQKLGDALARSKLPQAIVDAQVRQQLMSLAFAAGMRDPAQVSDAITQYFEEGTFSEPLKAALADEDLAAGPLVALATSLGASTRAGAAGGAFAGRRRLTEGGDGETTSVGADMEDFIYRGDGVRGTINPIDERDTFVGMKPGGAIDRAIGGGGGSVTVNIYGGDERRVYDVVKRVLQQSGIGPSRVSSRA